MAAIESSKIPITAYEPRLTTTLDTAMLDYIGFKLLGIAAAQKLDWSAIAETVSVSQANWAKTEFIIKDQAVIDLIERESKNPPKSRRKQKSPDKVPSGPNFDVAEV